MKFHIYCSSFEVDCPQCQLQRADVRDIPTYKDDLWNDIPMELVKEFDAKDWATARNIYNNWYDQWDGE